MRSDLADLGLSFMTQLLHIHPETPQRRLIRHAVDQLRAGGVIVYPTDSGYALGCHIGDKAAMERFRRIRHLDNKHNFTLVCRDLSEIATYAKVGKAAYRLIKRLTPGPYTFVLQATREVPRRLQNPKRRTIGLRVPDNEIVACLLEELAEPIISSTLILPGDDLPQTDPGEILSRLKHQVDLVIDGGYCGVEPTTVVDLVTDEPLVTRQGKGVAEILRQNG